MAKTKGYFGLDWIVCLILAIIPVTSWICGGAERIRRGKTLIGVIWLLTGGLFLIGWIIDLVTIIANKDLTILV